MPEVCLSCPADVAFGKKGKRNKSQTLFTNNSFGLFARHLGVPEGRRQPLAGVASVASAVEGDLARGRLLAALLLERVAAAAAGGDERRLLRHGQLDALQEPVPAVQRPLILLAGVFDVPEKSVQCLSLPTSVWTCLKWSPPTDCSFLVDSARIPGPAVLPREVPPVLRRRRLPGEGVRRRGRRRAVLQLGHGRVVLGIIHL